MSKLIEQGAVIMPIVGGGIAVQGEVAPFARHLDVIGPFKIEGGGRFFDAKHFSRRGHFDLAAFVTAANASDGFPPVIAFVFFNKGFPLSGSGAIDDEFVTAPARCGIGNGIDE